MSSQILVATPERTEILRFSDTVRIGRAETNGVVISNDLVSGEHLELRKTGEIWEIVDLDSTNGTFIDGERVTDTGRKILPGQTLVGISGAARLLEHYARRPQLQERLGQQIADHLERLIRPRGVAVVLEARHLCMEMRGVRKPGVVETRAVRGELADARWADTLRLAPER